MLQTSGVIGQQSLPTSTPCWSQDGDFALFPSIRDHAVGTNSIDRIMNGAVGGLSQAMLLQPTASWARIGSTNSHMLVNRLNQTRFPRVRNSARRRCP